MVNKFVAALAAGGVMMLAATAAQATIFTGTYSVSAFNETPGDLGLDISTANIAPGINLNLTAGGPSSGWFDLFRIWTDEGSLQGDDTSAKPISVTFSFTQPSPPFGGPVGGTTDGHFFFVSWGEVEWNAPIDITFGALGDGVLRVWLSDETFNGGPWTAFTPGEEHGATVKAKFKLIKDATVVDVPEPATLALFGLGLLGVGVARRRASR